MYSMLRETYLVPQHCQTDSLPQLLFRNIQNHCCYAAADLQLPIAHALIWYLKTAHL